MHRTALQGFRQSKLYDKVRPSYSSSVCERVFNEITSKRGENESHYVVEIGSGTGLFTHSFLNWIASSVTSTPSHDNVYHATEPLQSMRDVLVEKIPRENPFFSRMKVTEGMGENMSCIKEDGCVSGVVAAQAFHWMANKETVKEMGRIMKRKAPLILIWNTMRTDIDWQKRLEEEVITPEYEEEGRRTGVVIPRQQTGLWKRAFHQSEFFDENAIVSYPFYYSQTGNFDFLVDRIMSISVFSKLSDEEKQKRAKTILSILPSSSSCTLQYQTDVFVINRI